MSKAYYTDDVESVQKPNKRRFSLLMSLFAAILCGVLSIGVFIPSLSVAQAGGFLCGGKDELGRGFEAKGWKSFGDAPLADASNRSWTLQEAFGNGMSFPIYHGEGKGDGNWMIRDAGEDRGKSQAEWKSSLDKLKKERSFTNCTIGNTLPTVGRWFLGMAGLFANFASFTATKAFDPTFICKDSSSTGCINILSVIGGDYDGVVTDGTNGGIIGALTSGLFIPLLVVAVAIGGLYVMKLGIIQRQYRKAFGAAFWILCSATVAMMFLFRPMLIAKAPMSATNSIVSCVVGSFNGIDCMSDGSSGNPIASANPSTTSTSKNVCISDADGSLTEKASLAVNSLSCSIWKAFVLEPYSQANFGHAFEDLDTSSGFVKTAIKSAKYTPEDFCVRLKSSSSYSSKNPGGTLDLDSDGNKVCNLAAYQMYLQTNAAAQDNGGKSGSNGGTPIGKKSGEDPRWFKMILTISKDDGMWNSWSSTGSANKFHQGFLAQLSALLGGVLIVATSLTALMYYVISIVLIAFAPLFLLVGVHPGKGKKILMGWGELALSNILKYMASALFLIVAVTFYGAVLGHSKNVMISFLFVLILTLALWVYRKEIVGLLGRVELGGEKLSGALGEKLQNKAVRHKDRSKRLATAAAGTVAASTVAGLGAKRAAVKHTNKKSKEELGHRASLGDKYKASREAGKGVRKTARNTLGESVRRELKNGGEGFVGQTVASAVRGFENVSEDKKRDLHENARQAQFQASSDQSKAYKAEENLEHSGEKLQEASEEREKFYNNNKKAVQTAQNEADFRSVQDGALNVMKNAGKFEDFTKMQELVNKLERLKMDKARALASGNMSEAQNIQMSIDKVNVQKDDLMNDIKGDKNRVAEFNRGQRSYDNLVDRGIKGNKNLADHKELRSSAEGMKAITEDVSKIAEVEGNYAKVVDNFNKNLNEYQNLSKSAAENAAKASVFASAHTKFVNGEVLKNGKERKIYETADNAAKNAGKQAAERSQTFVNEHLGGAIHNANEAGSRDPLAQSTIPSGYMNPNGKGSGSNPNEKPSGGVNPSSSASTFSNSSYGVIPKDSTGKKQHSAASQISNNQNDSVSGERKAPSQASQIPNYPEHAVSGLPKTTGGATQVTKTQPSSSQKSTSQKETLAASQISNNQNGVVSGNKGRKSSSQASQIPNRPEFVAPGGLPKTRGGSPQTFRKPQNPRRDI